jgi:hypothetical protein
MRALNGLSKAETLLLVEIEHFAKTGQRPDGLQVTDEWVDESIKFLASKLRPAIESKAVISKREDAYCLVHIEAKKVWQLWKRGKTGEELDVAFRRLEPHILAAEEASKGGS